jgi:glycosyltransferase involved in cell wall biosynthesis
MHILILNWRDSKNPRGGGAEVLTHEVARRWVHSGHTVTLFCAQFHGSKPEETIDGVHILRRGSWFTVHIWAFFYYLRHLKQVVDVVIDEVHWYPFFSIWYAKHKTVLLVCEVAKDLFPRFFPYPLALMGRALERLYLRVYRNIPVLTISPSTKQDLIEEGFPGEHIYVLPMGIYRPKVFKQSQKESAPTFVFLGRLHPLKGVEDVIRSFALIHKKISNSKLWIIGAGENRYVKKIKNIVISLRLQNAVTFFGMVSEERKYELLGRSHLLLVASSQEGWGLIVPEASFVGTPAVAYRVKGLRDVIEDKKTGLLVDTTPLALANASVALIRDKILYTSLSMAAKEKSKDYTWDTTAQVALRVLMEIKEKSI